MTKCFLFLVTLSMSTVFSRTAYMVKNIDLRRSQSMPNYAPPPKKKVPLYLRKELAPM